MEDVQDRRIKIKAHHWPTFLYDESSPFDDKNHDKGLLRGHFLLRVSTPGLCFRAYIEKGDRYIGIYLLVLLPHLGGFARQPSVQRLLYTVWQRSPVARSHMPVSK